MLPARRHLVILLCCVAAAGCKKPKEPPPPPPELNEIQEIAAFRSCTWMGDREFGTEQLAKLNLDEGLLAGATSLAELGEFFAADPFNEDLDRTLAAPIRRNDKYASERERVGEEAAEASLLAGIKAGMVRFVNDQDCSDSL